MSVRRYAELLRTPGFPWLMGTSLLGRLPLGMTGLALVLLFSRNGHYSRAGSIVAAYVTGVGIAGPVVGRLVDGFGRSRILPAFAVIQAAFLCVVAIVPAGELAVVFVCSFFAGLSSPQVSAASRSLWPQVLSEEQLAVVYPLEATIQELVFIVGPTLVALTAGLIGPEAAVIASAVALVLGVCAFALHPSARSAPTTGARREGVAAERWRPPLPLTLVAGAGALVGAFNMVELAAVAFSRSHHSAAAAGVVLAFWSVGSLCGGLILGARWSSRSPSRGRTAVLMLAVAAGAALPVAATGEVLLGVLLFAGGLAIAPTLGVLYTLAGAEAAAHRQTEAFGWLSSGFQAGAAIGALIGGTAVEAWGSRPAFALAAGVVCTGGAMVALRRRDTASLAPGRGSGGGGVAPY